MKRNCRRNEEERRIHDEAVRLRKMTDAQLVAAAASRPHQKPAPAKDGLNTLLEGLGAGECKGVKGATVYKIVEYARERGLIE